MMYLFLYGGAILLVLIVVYIRSRNEHANYDVDEILNYEDFEKAISEWQQKQPIINQGEPTLPTPTSKELGIREGSKLEMVFNSLIKGNILTNEIAHKDFSIAKIATFIFKLRGKGLVIENIDMPNGECGYIFRKFNYDKIA